ncbi:hypothetical protein J2Z83_001731 [Virgibacillus natechei]|uniref:Uncharacterized protein n=2 Tax=Virgibacillus natechei TaxID=1216297 RepID=A0ABS4II15_9BACI|nr:hypothetical protein [Virgibacillus natechei]
MLMGSDAVMSGLLFYWFSWILWIVVTFFMEKSKNRTILACWILLSILSSDIYVVIGSYPVSIALLLMLTGSILLLLQSPHLIYHLSASFTIMIGYAAILLWEISSPILIILPRVILISFILGLVVILLAKGLYSQLGICLLGLSCGEIVHGLMLSSYGFNVSIGEMQFFDNVLFLLVIIVFVNGLHKGKYKLSSVLNNNKQSMRWQNE